MGFNILEIKAPMSPKQEVELNHC